MKKFWGITITLFTALSLAACGNKPATKNSSNSQSTFSVKQKSSSKSKSSSSKSSSASSSSSVSSSSSNKANATSDSTSSTKSETTADRLGSLTQQLKAALPSSKLPTTYPVASGQVLNTSYSGNASRYTIYFGTGSSALPFNTSSVNANAADISLSAQTYANAADAEAQINYQAPETGLPTVALGDNLTGTQQGAAGSTYTNWQEGRWSLTVQAINQNQENGLTLSRQVVALLSKEFLPIPATHGAISLRVNTGGLRLNSVTWRQGNILYNATGVDAMSLLQVVTLLR